MKSLKRIPRYQPTLLVTAMCAAVVSGCAAPGAPANGANPFTQAFVSDDPCSHTSRNVGIALGALAGALVGNQLHHSNNGRIVGAVAGATLGGVIGFDMDRRRCELSKIAKQHDLDLKVVEIKASAIAPVASSRAQASSGSSQVSNIPLQSNSDPTVGLKVVLKDNGRQFQSGSDELTPEAAGYFAQIADQYSYDVQKRSLPADAGKDAIEAVESLRTKRVLLVGHTDDTGNSGLNADLSERRAEAVAKIFRSRGIPDDHLFYQGAGETLPIADNRTDDGRARNRRVEIIDLSDEAALRAYLGNRKPEVAYYRNVPVKSGVVAAVSTLPAGGSASTTSSNAAGGTSPATTSSTGQTKKLAPVDLGPSGKAPAGTVTGMGRVEKFSGIDFGGVPVGTAAAKVGRVDIGRIPVESGGMSLISAAQADEPIAASCIQDRPRISHGVKSLKSGQDYSIDDYMPGLYGTSWFDTVNGNLVALTNVTVLRDGGLPATRPTLLVYRDYQPAPNGATKIKPTVTQAPDVNVYRGDKAVLYRVFAAAPLQCMDVVIPYEQRTQAKGSSLYYDRAQEVYVAGFNPKLAK